MDETVHIRGIGEARIGRQWANNRFQVGYGGDKKLAIYHMDNVIDADFSNGEWELHHFCRSSGETDCKISEAKKKGIINAVMSIPEARGSLRKYCKDAIKRLRKSVPRLEEEFKNSALRLELLENWVANQEET